MSCIDKPFKSQGRQEMGVSRQRMTVPPKKNREASAPPETAGTKALV
jgi:hypothetical protein